MEQFSANSNKKLNFILVGLGILILGAMIFMRKVKIQTDIDFSFLAGFHSTVNAITFFVLLYALYQIKRKNIEKHRKAIYIALSLSVLFLVSYVVYHSTTPETKFCHQGEIRYIYFFLLITHIILATIILPLVLIAFGRAYSGQYERHRKIARYVMPIWLYVCFSGPLCYLLLRGC